MMTFWTYKKYLVLGILTFILAANSTLAGANVSNKSQQIMQIAQGQPEGNTADEAQIKKVILLNEQKYHWQPQIDILAIVDGYAVTSVHDQNTGGQSVLKKEQDNWKIVCGTGGAFGKVEELFHSCKVPLTTAHHLLEIQAAQRR